MKKLVKKNVRTVVEIYATGITDCCNGKLPFPLPF